MMLNIRRGEVPLLIQKTAKEIAGTFFESNRTDDFRTRARSQRGFIKTHWHYHVADAVESLAKLLGNPGLPEDQKAQIAQAIFEFKERATEETPEPSLRRILN